MRYSKLDVLSLAFSTGIVPVFYHRDAETVRRVVKACYDGGIRVFEFTNRGYFADEVFGELSKYVLSACPGMVLGAGSVVDAATAAMYVQRGASFVVGPLFSADVAKFCHRRGVLYVPGCGSATEVGEAQESGCDLVKVFPGDVLGAGFVKSLKAPMPWSRFLVTGGVRPEERNLRSWFGAGADCVGIGSSLFPESIIESGDWGSVTELCGRALSIVADVR